MRRMFHVVTIFCTLNLALKLSKRRKVEKQVLVVERKHKRVKVIRKLILRVVKIIKFPSMLWKHAGCNDKQITFAYKSVNES